MPDLEELRRLMQEANLPVLHLDIRVGVVGVYEGKPPDCLTHDCPPAIFKRDGKWVPGGHWCLDERDIRKARVSEAGLNALPTLLAAHDADKARIAELEREVGELKKIDR